MIHSHCHRTDVDSPGETVDSAIQALPTTVDQSVEAVVSTLEDAVDATVPTSSKSVKALIEEPTPIDKTPSIRSSSICSGLANIHLSDVVSMAWKVVVFFPEHSRNDINSQSDALKPSAGDPRGEHRSCSNSLSYNHSTMNVRIFTTDATETAFYLYHEDEVRDLHAALERTIGDICRASREVNGGGWVNPRFDCVVFELAVKGATLNIGAIFVGHRRYLGILQYSQSTGTAEFMPRRSTDRVIRRVRGTIIFEDMSAIRIQYVSDWISP
ncbi:hypothetical protein ARMSODRAFT_1024227 [Armillaria solidipes]|uniref:Uncharacterized protein n=1 Tax=Armillaria solidipes TaxID=1076256 RepID=A0A2H3BAW9_9AGAR|nr:hypothetical protein ARMSODRAFT_1024227 [Armillaria solidipes]